MEQEQLIENEQIITQSSEGVVTLTTHRIRYATSGWGHAHITSIMLDSISSIQSHFKSIPLFIVLGVAAFIVGLFAEFNNESGGAIAGLAVGAVFTLLYFASRKHVVTVSSKGGAAISFLAKGMDQYEITKFIDQVEEAKNSRRAAVL
ncbi:hypothetical protein [Pontibacter harenae]|uniref:hypothetical protein n=1 Tax=Pontibacter harenae TaxID=2894083 RepID=UPI001E46FF16|nr:hypothetical protein [Pontibacter harenae]MCC9167218.1 hypothetical protein [Pontibacter harenae]